MALVPFSAPLVPYQPEVYVPPQQTFLPGPLPLVQYQPQQDWLYTGERNPSVGAYHDPQPAHIAARKEIYVGSLARPLIDEAYLAAHLSHQAQVSQFASPGQVLQFQSSTGKANLLTVLASNDTPNLGWRMLGDALTNYIIFRGCPDWRFPLYDSRLVELHDVARHVEFKVHALFMQELSQHAGAILAQLQAHPKRRIVLTGHGNGGSLATLMFLLMQRAGYERGRLVVYTFGSPLVGVGNPDTRYPLPNNFFQSIFNFVNEEDPVPLLLGQKDMHTVDRFVGTVENPLKNGRHLVSELTAYRPMGAYYHLTREGSMVDIPLSRLKFFLDIRRGALPAQQRLAHHAADAYVAKLRKVVHDN